MDVQGELRTEMSNSGMLQYYLNRIHMDSLAINWALLLGTKRIDLSEICEHEEYDDNEDKEDSFGVVLGNAAALLERLG